MPSQLGLPAALRRRGLTVELVPGWETRGSTVFAPFGAIAHWTAGPAYGDRPSLNVVVNGRPGLPGPLCQVFLTRGGRAIVVSANRANHAGVGFYKGADGNTDLFGCECEWDGSPGGLTDAQKWAYPRVMATFMDLGAKWIAGHDEYATPRGRKVDVGSYINTLRSQTYAIVNNTIPTDLKEDNMAEFTKAHADAIVATRAKVEWLAKVTGFGGTATQFWVIRNDIARIEATVRAQAAALEALAKSVGVDPEQVQATVKAAVEDALADVTLTLTTATEED